MTDDIGFYRKTTVTAMALVTGDNFEVVRSFVRGSALRPEPSDPADPTSPKVSMPVPWGYADASRFGSGALDYRTPDVPPCPPVAGYEGSGGYRGNAPDGAVFDYLHGRWIPLWAGDFVAAGPKGEHYPVEAAVHAETYEKVTESS